MDSGTQSSERCLSVKTVLLFFKFAAFPPPMLLPAMTNIFLKEKKFKYLLKREEKAKPRWIHFQYAISINILSAKLPRIRNKELVRALIFSEGIHVMERKTKESHVQEDMRERPNQQLPESKRTPEAVSEDLPVESAVKFARDFA